MLDMTDRDWVYETEEKNEYHPNADRDAYMFGWSYVETESDDEH